MVPRSVATGSEALRHGTLTGSEVIMHAGCAGSHLGGTVVNRDPIRSAGLLRCCIQTLRQRETPGEEGDVQPCQHCSSWARFRDGAWEWARRVEKPR